METTSVTSSVAASPDQPAFITTLPTARILPSASLDGAWLASNGMQDFQQAAPYMLWTVGGIVPCKAFPGSDQAGLGGLLTSMYTTDAAWAWANTAATHPDGSVNVPEGSWGGRCRETRRRGSRQKAKKAAAAAAALPLGAYASSEDATGGSENENEQGAECPFRARWGTPLRLCQDDALSAEVVEYILQQEPDELHDIVMWLLRYVRPLAFSKHGTHIVQKLIEQGNKADKEIITAELKPCVRELYESAHGNHALAKIIEQLPSASVAFIVREFWGKAREVARHQYGCRILERLLEHCPDDGDMVALIDEIVRDSEPLCRHPFGNFVVQHLLEHGSRERREAILNHVAHKLPHLAMHRTASHFVQQLLDYGEPDMQQFIVQKLLEAPPPESLLEVAGSRYGSFVIEQLGGLEASYDQVRAALLQVLPYLTVSQLKFAKRVLDRFGLNTAAEN